jgi:hypothetical protein
MVDDGTPMAGSSTLTIDSGTLMAGDDTLAVGGDTLMVGGSTLTCGGQHRLSSAIACMTRCIVTSMTRW